MKRGRYRHYRGNEYIVLRQHAQRSDHKHVRIERIVSTGHPSPEGFWYDQDEHEWVVVLMGRAKLIFEGNSEPVEMGPGDYMNIPAHRKHRVEWTSPDEPTVWLAVFYSEWGVSE